MPVDAASRAGEGARRRRGPAMDWLLAILLTLACAAIALEIGLRLTMGKVGRLHDIVHTSGDSRSYELRPNASTLYSGFWDAREKPTEWTVNSDGLRSNREVPPRTGKYRIVTYGDSETFGWAVRLGDTFQRRIEATDPDVEVLNMGVPGYNIENIVDYMALTLDRYRPDRVIYLFHKNDMDRALTLSPVLSKSYAYYAARYLAVVVRSEGRKAHRRTPEAYRFLTEQLERMIALCRRRGIPLTIGVLHREFEEAFEPARAYAAVPDEQDESRLDHDDIGSTRSNIMNLINANNLERDAGGKPVPSFPHPGLASAFHTNVLDFNDIWYGLPKRDHHMAETAHAEMASRFCAAISGGIDGKCTPRGWKPGE